MTLSNITMVNFEDETYTKVTDKLLLSLNIIKWNLRPID
jgi:hypothetical protein